MKPTRKFLPLLFAAYLATLSVATFADCTLRQSDALELKLGPFVDETDGRTIESGLTISQGDVQLAKCAAAGDCGAFAQKNDTTSCAYDAVGMYECDLNTTDTDTVGILEIVVNEAGALPVFKTCEVIEEAVYDADRAAGATGLRLANVTQFNGTNATTSAGRPEVNTTHAAGVAWASGAIVSGAFAANSLTAAAAASDFFGEGADAVWDEDMTAHQTQGTAGQVLGDSAADTDSIWSLANTNLTATVGSRASQSSLDTVSTNVGTPSNLGSGATLSANAVDIEGQTDDIGTAGAGLTAADDSVMSRLGAPVGASLSADIAAAKSDTAAILDDTGTSGVLIADSTSNCIDVLGCDVQGTLNGTHSTTQADLGTNAPANDITGYTITVPSRNFSRTVATYNTSTGIATWTDATAVTLANSDQYYLWATAPPSASAGGSTDVETIEGVDATDAIDARIAAAGLATATNLSTLITRVGTPTDLGSGATLSANAVDIEGQTDDIGTAGAGLTAADDAVMSRLGAPVGANLSADIAAIEDQTDDIGVAGAGLTAADDAVMTRLGTPAGVSVSADIAAIEDQTDELAAFIADVGANGAGLTALPWAAAWDAEVQSEVADALAAIYLDQLFASTYDPASKPGAADALLNELVESDAGVARFTSNALENGPAGGGGGSSDWSVGEREQIRHRLGIDGTANAPTATPSLATASALQAVDDLVDDLESRIGTPTNQGSGATVAGNLQDIEGQTDDIGVAGAGLTAAGMTAAQLRSALGLSAANVDAQLAALGTDLDSLLVAVAAVPDEVRDVPVDGTRTLGCALSAIMAVEAGRAVTTDNDTTFYAADGTTVRAVGNAPTPGNRTVTVTCP